MLKVKYFKTPSIFLIIGIVLTPASYFLDDFIIQFFLIITNPVLTFLLSWLISLQSVFVVFLIIPTLFIWENKKNIFLAPLWITAITTSVIESLIKYLILRRRPFGIEGTFGFLDSSFPSAHTAIAISLAFILSKIYPKLSIIWYILAVIVGINRLYFQVHYFSDVIAGAFLGLVISSLIYNFSDANKKISIKK